MPRNSPKGGIVRTFVALCVILVFTGVAAGATQATWTARNMATAAKALGYPKPHARRVTCRGKTTFRCVATYRRRRVFYAAWMGYSSGWLCAGKTRSSCVMQRRGFIPTAAASSLSRAAELAARGYMAFKYDTPDPYVYAPCTKAGFTAYQCGYKWTNNQVITVTVSFKQAKGGYTMTASAVIG